MIVTEIKNLLSLKIKSRTDGYSDQFNRIFIVKILLVCSLIMGLNWYKDTVSCIAPGSLASSFVSEACWIQGVYIYRELAERIDDVAYYGLPKSIENDGIRVNGELCRTKQKGNSVYQPTRVDPLCKPLTKSFFLQYQYMPFYIAALTILFYLPYIIHNYGNSDMISLKRSLKSGNTDGDKLIDAYFNHRVNPVRQLRTRILFNYLVKILYIAANLVSYFFTDHILLGKFANYGVKWTKWSKLENHIMYDYLGMRDHPKPGNELLPPFGYCTIYEAAADVRTTQHDKHTFVCELSQHILYQYCLILLWFTLVFGIFVSCIGLVMLLMDHVITITCVLRHGNLVKKMYNNITLRECEYLEFIRRRNLPLYAEILQKLRVERYHLGLAEGNIGFKDSLETPPPGFADVSTRL